MEPTWPKDWDSLVRGVGCNMCELPRTEEDQWGVRIHSTANADAMLQRAGVQRGYTLVIWRGRHITEPYELTEAEAGAYWQEVHLVAQALATFYRPLKMNYETLGNTLPHLHTHLLPRYVQDPAPGRPFPFASEAEREPVPGDELWRDARALRKIMDSYQG